MHYDIDIAKRARMCDWVIRGSQSRHSRLKSSPNTGRFGCLKMNTIDVTKINIAGRRAWGSGEVKFDEAVCQNVPTTSTEYPVDICLVPCMF